MIRPKTSRPHNVFKPGKVRKVSATAIYLRPRSHNHSQPPSQKRMTRLSQPCDPKLLVPSTDKIKKDMRAENSSFNDPPPDLPIEASITLHSAPQSNHHSSTTALTETPSRRPHPVGSLSSLPGSRCLARIRYSSQPRVALQMTCTEFLVRFCRAEMGWLRA